MANCSTCLGRNKKCYKWISAQNLSIWKKSFKPDDVNVDATHIVLQQLLLLTHQYFYKRDKNIVLLSMTNSLEYKLWISQMGETDISGSNRVISSQPHLGLYLNLKITEHGMQFNHKI